MASLSKERGNVYRIHWRFKIRVGPRAGETLEGSHQLGRCRLADAKAKLRELDEWEERVKTGRHVPDQDVGGVVDAWLRERELTCTPQTLDRTNRVVALYSRWREIKGLPSRTITDIARRSDLTAWRDYRLEKEAGRKTVANDLSTLSALFEWCVHEKYLADNPVARVSRPRFIPQKEGMPLTRYQAGRWLWSIKPRVGSRGRGPWSWDEVRRKRQLIVFLLNTGLRNGELCALNIEDLRIDDSERLVYVMGKGLKQRWVPLNRAALAVIRLHLRMRDNPKHGPLFVTPAGTRYNVRQLASEIVKTGRCSDEPIRVNPHNLRHTFATWLARSVPDVSIAQKILGHENVNTTLKCYVHCGDYELADATAYLRPRRQDDGRATKKSEDRYKLIPFPKKQLS